MFEEVAGVPAHPLFVHAAVVFVPLLAVVALAYALLPFVRPHTRLVLFGLALAAPGAALVAKLSGDKFRTRLIGKEQLGGEVLNKVTQHQDFGNMTVYTTLALGVVTLALVFFVQPRRRSPVAAGASRFEADDGPGGHDAPAAPPAPAAPGSTLLSLVLAGVTVAAAAVSLYYVIRTGDSGAKAVWTGF